MTFQPIVPFQGFAGWKFLQRTIETQQNAFNSSVQVNRITDGFRERISAIKSADDLIGDRELLQVALGAYGLEEDINNRYFIKKVLEEGTLDESSLANRLSDKRYFELSKAFGFGDFSTPNTALSSFAETIIARFEQKSFETAVGSVDPNMRLALNYSNQLSEVVDSTSNRDAQWFSIMGNPPLRKVVEAALGLPDSIGAIDIDQQLQAFKSGSQRVFGTDNVADIANREDEEKMIRLFMLRSQVQQTSGLDAGSIALSLLRQI